jgi:hypothetical protein
LGPERLPWEPIEVQVGLPNSGDEGGRVPDSKGNQGLKGHLASLGIVETGGSRAKTAFMMGVPATRGSPETRGSDVIDD